MQKKFIAKKLRNFLKPKFGQSVSDSLSEMIKVAHNSNAVLFIQCIKDIFIKSKLNKRIPLIYLVDSLYRNIKAIRTAINFEPFVVFLMENTFVHSHLAIRLKLLEILNEWDSQNLFSPEMRFRIRNSFQKLENVRPVPFKKRPENFTNKRNRKEEKSKAFPPKKVAYKIEIGPFEKKPNGLKCKCEIKRSERLIELSKCLSKKIKLKEIRRVDENNDDCREYYKSAEEWRKSALDCLVQKDSIGEISAPKNNDIISRRENGSSGRGKGRETFRCDGYPPLCELCGEEFGKCFDQTSQEWIYEGDLTDLKGDICHKECVQSGKTDDVIELT